jgi:hypothetical protein
VLFGLGEKGDELMGGRAQVAAAAIGRQRTDVQQNTGGTLKFHLSIIGWMAQRTIRCNRQQL